MTICLFLFIPIQYLAILSSVAIAVGSYFFVLGFRLLARQRALISTPSSKIGNAARGLIEVSGLVSGPCTTLAAITEEPCFLYQTTVWQQPDGKKKENEWEKVADEALHLPFFIKDSTGQLLVEARGADLELHPRFRGEYSPTLLDSDDVPQSVSTFLSRHGVALDRTLRIEEWSIKADDALYVAGTLMENAGAQSRPSSPGNCAGADPRNPIRDKVRPEVPVPDWRPSRNHSSEPIPAPEIIRLASTTATSTREMSQQAKIAAALTRASVRKPSGSPSAALPYAGVAVAETAASATNPARSEIYLPEVRRREASPGKVLLNEVRVKEVRLKEGQPEPTTSDLAPSLVIMKGTDDPTFVISFRSQNEIGSATTWRAAAIVCGGTAIALLGLYVLCARIALL